MIYVLLAVICSVTVAVLLKLAKQAGVNTEQLIVWNYPVAIICTWIFLQPSVVALYQAALITLRDFTNSAITSSAIHIGDRMFTSLPWILYGSLSVLLPTIFVMIARSLQFAGLVKTEVAQRMSLFIPLLAAYFIFDERFTGVRLLGLILGLISIICCISWHKSASNAGKTQLLYPLAVFLGMGIIDIFFKKVALQQVVSYSTSMFIIFVGAFLVALLYLGYLLVIRRQPLAINALLWGLAVGFFNFANILCYMKAHRELSENPSIVFSAMNIGVIVLGALIGVYFFKEKLSSLNKIGLAIAVIAVLLIAFL